MMASSSKLSIDCKPQSYSMLLKSFGDQQTEPQNQTQKLEEFLARLEEERLKIDAFKRELPLCMTLLTNAMEASRQQLQSYRSNQTPKPVLEEFIPLKNSFISECSDQKSLNMSDKANWMTSAQLWSQTSEGTKPPPTILSSPKETEIGLNVSPKLNLDTKQRNGGGAFMPFSKDRGLGSDRVSSDLALANCVEKDIEDKKSLEMNSENCAKVIVEHVQGENDTQMPVSNTVAASTSQAQRKARRCWSPDLHRRFVNALQMLGGSQVATPKQIRELMKVDGLTNDEVKSHLQKYRLHTRRPSPTPHTAGGPPPQLVVLGSIWVPPEYAAAAQAGGAPQNLYSTHPSAPPHYCPPEFYPTPAAAMHHHQLQLHHHHHLQMYKAPTPLELGQSSPESGIGGSSGEQSESIEERKSDSNGSERKGLVALRVEGEESNGSEITLKF